jgi:hypothetical protein
MRKADYATLARLLRAELVSARVIQQDTKGHEAGACGSAVEVCMIRLAEGFADSASVDRTAFLKACGIK